MGTCQMTNRRRGESLQLWPIRQVPPSERVCSVLFEQRVQVDLAWGSSTSGSSSRVTSRQRVRNRECPGHRQVDTQKVEFGLESKCS